MKILFLDLASHHGAVALVTEEKTEVLVPVDHRMSDADLLPLIEKALADTGWSYQDLTQLACVIGPGGFTSLRVAVSAINALAFSLTIPAAGIHLSALKGAQADAQDFWWLHSTKKVQLFMRGFGEFANTHGEPQLVQVEDLSKILSPGDQWIGELIPEHQTKLSETQGVPAQEKSIEEVLPGFLAAQAYGHAQLEPWYGRGW
jgi:tRNA threonylcarbamoyl adenosine modification protein YeaZ